MRWDNYEIAWQRARLLNNLFNSVTVTAGTVLLIILTGALASYALARLKIGRISGAIFALFILGIILPTFSGLIPLFKLMQLFGSVRYIAWTHADLCSSGITDYDSNHYKVFSVGSV